MTLGKIIQTARKQVGITQVELGNKLGVSGSMIGQWENDLRKPKSETISRIADALGEPFMNLFLADTNDFMAKTQEMLDAQRAEMEAKAKAYEIASESLFTKQADAFIASTIGRSIISTFHELNEYGQEEAMERIIELTFLPQFSKQAIPLGFEEYVDSYLSDRYAKKYRGENFSEQTEAREMPQEVTLQNAETPSDSH